MTGKHLHQAGVECCRRPFNDEGDKLKKACIRLYKNTSIAPNESRRHSMEVLYTRHESDCIAGYWKHRGVVFSSTFQLSVQWMQGGARS